MTESEIDQLNGIWIAIFSADVYSAFTERVKEKGMSEAFDSLEIFCEEAECLADEVVYAHKQNKGLK